jgi:GTP cyclohydrolase FolE2
MTATGLIDPKVHDARAIRRAGPELLGLALLDARIGRYHVEVENHESIHNHAAYASIERM